MAARSPYYRGVRGSAALATRPLRAPAPAPEALEPGEMRRVPFEGELLGAVRVRAALREVKDPLAEGQRPDRIAACLETIRRRAARAPGAWEGS